MAQTTAGTEPRADLQTAQNRMFSFVTEAMQQYEKQGRISTLLENAAELDTLFATVRGQVFDLLHLPVRQRDTWHMGIADSGKRTIELLVNFLCPADENQNGLLDTENYVGFNKFSAAKVLEIKKGVAFQRPFEVPLGQALTVNSNGQFAKCAALFEGNQFRTLWLPWNSTSTGIRENIARIVQCRNHAHSSSLIIADAASLRLFSRDWAGLDSDQLPDVFFFSLRKQALPYDGPNDEVHQAKNSGALILFNDRALAHARSVDAEPLYGCSSLPQLAQGLAAQDEQRANHVRHLLKLNCALDAFNAQDPLQKLDDERETARQKILSAFSHNGTAPIGGFTLLSDPVAQSDSAYILKVPKRTTAKEVIATLKAQGILISASMHPKLDGQRHVRFAFYPGNQVNEVACLLKSIGGM
ncbi:MAG: hypothetical protein HKP58_08560 [Desulfatitalea sp.]|nr:hypothetical protein [Desulfatitalea sp.]NNK00451.1 hypothetical protein [Desulfatitalea sp.]